MTENFKCKDCHRHFFVASHIKKFSSGSEVFLTLNRATIVCPECNSESIEYIKNDGMATNIASFANKSNSEKAKIMKARAEKHARTKVETEKRKNVDDEFFKKHDLKKKKE